MNPELNYRLDCNALKYHSPDGKLSFLVFYTIEDEPDFIKVWELIENKEEKKKGETFDKQKFTNILSPGIYEQILRELDRRISLYALFYRNLRLNLNLATKPIHLNFYNSELAEILTQDTERLVKKYLKLFDSH